MKMAFLLMAQLQTYKIELLVLFFLSLVQFYLLKRAAFEWSSFSVNQSMDLISGFLLMFRVSQLFSVNFFKLHSQVETKQNQIR